MHGQQEDNLTIIQRPNPGGPRRNKVRQYSSVSRNRLRSLSASTRTATHEIANCVSVLPSYDGVILQLPNEIHRLFNDDRRGFRRDPPEDWLHPVLSDLILLLEHRKVEQRAQEPHVPKQTDEPWRRVRLRIEI